MDKRRIKKQVAVISTANQLLKDHTVTNLLYPWKIEFTKFTDLINDIRIQRSHNPYTSPPLAAIIEHYRKIINKVLNPTICRTYKLIAHFSAIYRKLPKIIKRIYMGRRKIEFSLDSYIDSMTIDRMRSLLKSLIERNSNTKLHTKDIYIPSISITHDIDTKEGLRNSIKMFRIEEKYNVKSTWFISIGEFNDISAREIVKQLSSYAEIGCHGYYHSPSLVLMEYDKLLKTFLKAKNELERVINRPIHGFRAPLLQHNSTIFNACIEVGFSYTSTTPTLEYNHPQTLGEHGIKTAFPINIEGIIEIPVSVIQDHQLLYIHKLGAKEALDVMLSITEHIVKSGGQAVILIHPDYDISLDLKQYENFINCLLEISEIRCLHEIYTMVKQCMTP